MTTKRYKRKAPRCDAGGDQKQGQMDLPGRLPGLLASSTVGLLSFLGKILVARDLHVVGRAVFRREQRSLLGSVNHGILPNVLPDRLGHIHTILLSSKGERKLYTEKGTPGVSIAFKFLTAHKENPPEAGFLCAR